MKQGTHNLRNLKRCLNKSAILSAIIVLLSSGCPYSSSRYIETNSFEGAYLSMAVDLNAAELCYKISPNAVVYAGLNSYGSKIISTRAKCFYTVAVQTHNSDLCKHVETLYWGSKMTRADCERETAEFKDKPALAIGADHELVLRLLGYDDEDLNKLNLEEREYPELYMAVQITPEFRAKLNTLPNFAVSDDLAKKELDAIAPECIKDENNNPLCFKIKCGLVRGPLDPACWQK